MMAVDRRLSLTEGSLIAASSVAAIKPAALALTIKETDVGCEFGLLPRIPLDEG
jgi:hypothetical protein